MVIAERLIRMFSFAGDTVLDPFVGSGTTTVAAIAAGRHSIGNEIDAGYLAIAQERVWRAISEARTCGATHAILCR